MILAAEDLGDLLDLAVLLSLPGVLVLEQLAHALRRRGRDVVLQVRELVRHRR